MTAFLFLVSPIDAAQPKGKKQQGAASPAKAAPGAAPAPQSGQAQEPTPLSETIKGEVKEQLEIKKQPPSIELEVKDIVESGTARTDEVLQQAKPIPSDADFDHYSAVNSKQVMQPWNPLIPEPPLVSFYPGLSNIPAKKWEFRVSDQKGEIVKVVKGKGVPPKEVQWDGKNERGAFITVGTLYSYQFLTFDENGNAQTFPGEPFQIDALKYKQKGKIFVEFAIPRLFVKDQSVMSPSMEGLWARALDVVRENSNGTVTVEVYSESVKSPLAEERRQVLVGSISDATAIPAVDIRHSVEKVIDRGEIARLILQPR
ncbi:MAG: hypothetical protein LHV69_07535 [Elusimicrobia bacterium]|nr:hypothetical protein [Candidatus Obscuribacterium magneticum]